MDTHTQRISGLLEKIRMENEKVGAFIEIYGEEALAKANALDAKATSGKKPGRLAGKIIA